VQDCESVSSLGRAADASRGGSEAAQGRGGQGAQSTA